MSSREPIILYYSWYSICSEKVLLCLFEKGLAFKGRHVDLLQFDQVDPAYLEINPKGMVPTLVHGRRAIPDSVIINEYLDDAFADPPLKPAEPGDRALMRQWVADCGDIVFPAAAVLSQKGYIAAEMRQRWPRDELEALIRRKRNPERIARQLRTVREGVSDAEAAAARARIHAVLEHMETALRTRGPWLAGGYSLADIAMAPNLRRLDRLGLAQLWQGHPRVTDWYGRMRARPAFDQAIAFPPIDEDTGRPRGG